MDSVNTTDNLDNSPILVVDADSYSGNENKIGNYQVTFKATDVSGNYTTKTIDIIVDSHLLNKISKSYIINDQVIIQLNENKPAILLYDINSDFKSYIKYYLIPEEKEDYILDSLDYSELYENDFII